MQEDDKKKFIMGLHSPVCLIQDDYLVPSLG